jgi:aspartate 1-decarboxylase
MRIFLSAKLHGGTVTQCNLQYEGSCGIGPDLLRASGILPLEQISVLNLSTGGRLETYAIRAGKDGVISLNGAAARHASPGDKVIILAYASLPDGEVSQHKARIVILGADNKIVASRVESPASP